MHRFQLCRFEVLRWGMGRFVDYYNLTVLTTIRREIMTLIIIISVTFSSLQNIIVSDVLFKQWSL